MALEQIDLDILDFEESWNESHSNKIQAIRDVFNMTSTVYYIRLNALLDNPEAIYARPVTVSRLRRLREKRASERRSNSD